MEEKDIRRLIREEIMNLCGKLQLEMINNSRLGQPVSKREMSDRVISALDKTFEYFKIKNKEEL